MQELLDVFTGMGTQLGFTSAGIAYAYIGLILASLLCVFYGLVLWIQGKVAIPARGWCAEDAAFAEKTAICRKGKRRFALEARWR